MKKRSGGNFLDRYKGECATNLLGLVIILIVKS